MKKIVLVAADIRSTHNVGSLFRTCDGFGASLILVGITPRPSGKRDDRLPHIGKKAHAAISKTALGAEETVEWDYFETLQESIKFLKQKGYRIYAVEQHTKSKDISLINSDEPTALFVGPEVTGFSKEDLELFDEIFEIPMRGDKESFNVSVVAGIALYQATRSPLMLK